MGSVGGAGVIDVEQEESVGVDVSGMEVLAIGCGGKSSIRLTGSTTRAACAVAEIPVADVAAETPGRRKQMGKGDLSIFSKSPGFSRVR